MANNNAEEPITTDVEPFQGKVTYLIFSLFFTNASKKLNR